MTAETRAEILKWDSMPWQTPRMEVEAHTLQSMCIHSEALSQKRNEMTDKACVNVMHFEEDASTNQSTQYAHTSYNEQAMFYYVNKLENAVNRMKINGVEADIIIPRIRVAVEYDGERWHTVEKIESDVQKYYHMYKEGYVLIRIREPKCPVLPNYPGKVFQMTSLSTSAFQTIIVDVLNYLHQYIPQSSIPTVNLKADSHAIAARVRHAIYEQSLEARYPNLAAEWDYDNNGELTPSMITPFSDCMVYWLCPSGHSYLAKPGNRVSGKGCGVCSGKQVIAGVNDIESQRPDLLKYWNAEKNAPIQPCEVYYNTHKRFWWTCPCGQIYEATVEKNTGRCPICAANGVHHGVDDFATTHPNELKYWDATKNTLLPTQIKSGSTHMIHWCCPEGHKYIRRLNQSVEADFACPICNGYKLVPGINDLATTHPDIAAQWHPTKNGALRPTDVLANSKKNVWWQCVHGHEYRRSIKSVIQSCQCPECQRKKFQVFAIHVTTQQHVVFESPQHAAKALDVSKTSILHAIKHCRPTNNYICSYNDFVDMDTYRSVCETTRSGVQVSVNKRKNTAQYKTCPIKAIRLADGCEIQFESHIAATKALQLTATAIADCLRGKRKTAGGYTFHRRK